MSDTPSPIQQQQQLPEASLDLDSTPVSIDTKAANLTSLPTTATLADKTSKDSTKDAPSSSPSTLQETTPSSPSPAQTSFYDGLDLELEGDSLSQSTSSPSPSPPPSQPTPPPAAAAAQSTTPTATAEPSSGVSTDGNVTPSTTNRFGAKKMRGNPGSNISRRITMLAAGKNENGSDLHTTEHAKAPSQWGDGETTPDGSEYPDSFFEEILRSDQTTISRSFTTMPKPTPRSTTFTSKSSIPLRIPSSSTSSAAAAGDDTEPAFVPSGDVEEDLKRLQAELTKTKETKSKAEADAKAQRVTVMSLKTEVQLVRNVLKRRETELGDVKDMSTAYETELAELRQKLEQAERQLSRGQGEMEAKVRALERLRDESIARIQTLDQEIKKLREQLQAAEKSNNQAQAELVGLRSEVEELAPYRDAALEQRELKAQVPIKIKELSEQITQLEDTRDAQAVMIEELETKITTVEAEALEFKGKAELEYEQLSDGFKVLKTRRSEEIKVLKAELEQHKLQEQIIEKLQGDIDQLQSALSLVASSQSTENARINQVTAELNEALALKDQEVVQVRQNMTEFEESHNRLVSSLQATLATINDEADSARKSRDEAVSALESLREELEALRHSLPINNKHMSLSQWSAEQQQSQQDQLKAIQDLEEKLDGQVEGVKEGQQRAGILEANRKRKSQQLTLDLEHHLQLSSALVQQQSNSKEDASADQLRVPDLPTKATGAATTAEATKEKDILSKDLESPVEPGSVSVRTMLKFLSQLQGRPSDLKETNATHHRREDTQMTVTDDNDIDYEEQLRVYLTQLNDVTLVEPWAKEKELEHEIQQLETKIQTLLADLSSAHHKETVAKDALEKAQASFEAQLQEERDQRDHLELLERQEREEIEEKLAEERRVREEEILEQQHSIQSKEQELTLKESTLREKELTLKNKEQELIAKEEAERHKRADSFPVTPPFSAPITPFGSPGNADLLPGLLAAHGRSLILEDDEKEKDSEDEEVENERKEEEEGKKAKEREQQAEVAAQQAKLIKSLEDKIAQLEKRADEQQQTQATAFPSPPMSVTPRLSVSMRSSLLSNPPDTPPPTIALPPIPTDQESSRSSPAISEDGVNHHNHHLPSHPRKKSMSSGVIHTHSSESLATKAAAAAATEAAVAAAVAKYQEEQKAMSEKLLQFEAELSKTQSKNKQLETDLVTIQKQQTEQQQQQQQQQVQTHDVEVRKLKQENTELAQVLEEIRQSLDQAQNQARGLEALKTQLEAQVQKERQAKDDANRMKDHLQTQLEEEKMKKKGGFLCF